MGDRGDVVLVAGSLHYDIMVEADHLPRLDETAIGSRWFPKFGGKGGNQAVAAARAGARARMVGAIGDDGFGQFLRAALVAGQVDDRFVRVAEGAGSGMSVAIQDRNGNYAATIVSGANLTLGAAHLGAEVWDDVGLLIVQNEVPEAANFAAAAAARARGVPVVLNAAPWREMPDDLLALVDVLVVNAVEAEMMGAAPVADLEGAAAAARYLSARCVTVIVTAGDRGLAAMADGAAMELPAQRVQVVSSHGAGDAFIGALAAAMVRGDPVPQACSVASAAAARHVAGEQRPDAAIPHRRPGG